MKTCVLTLFAYVVMRRQRAFELSRSLREVYGEGRLVQWALEAKETDLIATKHLVVWRVALNAYFFFDLCRFTLWVSRTGHPWQDYFGYHPTQHLLVRSALGVTRPRPTPAEKRVCEGQKDGGKALPA